MDFWKIFLAFLAFEFLFVGAVVYWWSPRKGDSEQEMHYKVARRAHLIMQWKDKDPSSALKQARAEYRRGLL